MQLERTLTALLAHSPQNKSFLKFVRP